MWRGEMWRGLLRWWQDDPSTQRAVIMRTAARRSIRALLVRDHLRDLGLEQFLQDVCQFGHLAYPDGRPVEARRVDDLDPSQLERLLEAGDLVVIGNRSIESTLRVCPQVLPGLEDVRIDELRGFLHRLLYGRGDAVELVQKAAAGEAPVGAACASMILCLCGPRARPIWTDERVAGLRRLALLTGFNGGVSEAHESYARFGELVATLQDASEGVLDDLLAADLFLCRLAELRDPRAWKIAVGLTVPEAEAAAIAHQCLEHGFAAIAPEDAEDPNVARLRDIAPGDCVVMHLRGRVGAIGRVTRPYYEIERDDADPLDRRWWRRIDVEWLPGDREYRSLLSGAQQRFSVVELAFDTFWAIAAMYRQSPECDRLLGPLRGAWAFRCDEARWQALSRLDKPLPLRDHWAVQLDGDVPAPGDLVFLRREGTSGGICALARVISEPQRRPRDGRGVAGVNLLYQRILDEPLGWDRLGRDPRTASWGIPADVPISRMTPEQTAAVAEMLALPPESYFLLLADGRDEPSLRPQTTYRFSHSAAGHPAELSAAIAAGTVGCLAYHGSPEHAFTGFVTVLALTAHEGAPNAEDSLELRLDLCRFPRRTGGAMGPRSPLASPVRRRGRAGRTRTVLPVSAYDFYRVVGAGMGVTGGPVEAVTIEEVAHECGAAVEPLEEIERLLRERGQMIFYGPPGTGKTWVALHMAHYLADGDESRYDLVQFHPSYSYEDFIEGIRPRVVEGGNGRSDVIYPIVAGAFVSFCNRARRDPHNTYVFVIDEINRAHVSNVFGELMLALEYRDREVELAHSAAESEPSDGAGRFAVPVNVLLLATMNTADRSTALVDYALRRRFVFYPFFPDDHRFVGAMFRNWLAENAPRMAWVADLLAIVNECIEPDVGRHLLIGHSYFMRATLTEDTVREVWRFQLLPLLEEYFAGMPERLDELDIDDLIRQAQARSADPAHERGRELPAPGPAPTAPESATPPLADDAPASPGTEHRQ